MAEPRHVTLIRAMRDLMREAGRGPHVKSIFECTATWDDAECDGHCLLEELDEWLDDIASAPTDELATENARLRSANAKLVEACKEAAALIGGYVADIGPCDHSVGICYCGERISLDRIKAAIAEAEAQP